jgi:AcrR family transcriptional regulator
VQEIVDAAHVSKPTLYYYFPSKARLYKALVNSAHDERYRLLIEAARAGRTVEAKLEAIVIALFEFSRQSRDLMRLAFATAFAAPGELPDDGHNFEKARRNYEFVRALVQAGQQAGELSQAFDSEELAFGIYGQINTYVMAHLVWPECRLDRRTARRVVTLFLTGARAFAGRRRARH